MPSQRCEPRLPLRELGGEPGEEGGPVGVVVRGVGRIDARQRLEMVAVMISALVGIEPVVWIAAAVGVAVTGPIA